MSGLGGINFSLPDINGTDFSKEKEIKELKNYMALLTKQLQFTLNNLDPEDNFTEEANQKWESVVTDDYVTSAIEQSADHILLTVSKEYATNSKMESAILQSAEEIILKVSSEYATNSKMESAIQQKAENILLSVKGEYTTKEETNSIESRFNISMNGIRSTVSAKVGKDEIISSINQSAEEVTISAGKINLNGPTIANFIKVLRQDGLGSSELELKPGFVGLGKSKAGDYDVELSGASGLNMTGEINSRTVEVRVRPTGIELEQTKGPYPRYRTRMYADGIIKEEKKNASSNFVVIWSAG